MPTRTRKDSRRSGLWPLAYMGVEPVSPPLLFSDNRPPTPNDRKNFNVGTIWIDRSTAPNEDIWMLVNLDGNVARWLKFDFGGAGIETLTGNFGGAVGADALKNIDVLGVPPYVVTGNPGAWTLTISDDGTMATTYTTDAGNAIPAANTLNIVGGLNVNTTGAGSTVTINLDNPGVGVVQSDAFGVLTASTGLDGQVLISATAGTPAWANIVSTDGTVVIANGANTIDLSTAGGISGIGYFNIGMTVDTGASTITMHSASGAAFSATNKGIVQFASKLVPGTFVVVEITANVAIAWANMNGNTMGTMPATAWANNLPLYVYAVLDSTEKLCTFGLARMPHHTASGAAANIGTPAFATADHDLSLFLFQNVTIADYANNPVVVLGSVKATKSAVDAWTFLAIKGGDTGIGGFQLGTSFTFPQLQNGAVHTYLYSPGATVPHFSTGGYRYTVYPHGMLTLDMAVNILTAAGIGAQTLYIMVPLIGTLIRAAGTFSVGDASISNVALRGTYKGLYIDGMLPNGYFGIEFVKNEVLRLQSQNYDTINGFSSQLAGAHSYMLENNQLP